MKRFNDIGVDLANYKSIAKWTPHIGDIIICHGLFTHWFGIVSQISKDQHIHVIKAGLPILLFSMSPSKMEKSKKEIDIYDIKSSTSGKYAVMQTIGGACVWYV